MNYFLSFVNCTVGKVNQNKRSNEQMLVTEFPNPVQVHSNRKWASPSVLELISGLCSMKRLGVFQEMSREKQDLSRDK